MLSPLIITTMQLARISSRPILLARASRYSFSSSSSASSTAEATTRVLWIGDVLKVSKRFSESDVSGYSSISGDRNPIHFDDAFARAAAGFDRGRVVHGMLVTSLFPTLMATHFVFNTVPYRSDVRLDPEQPSEHGSWQNSGGRQWLVAEGGLAAVGSKFLLPPSKLPPQASRSGRRVKQSVRFLERLARTIL